MSYYSRIINIHFTSYDNFMFPAKNNSSACDEIYLYDCISYNYLEKSADYLLGIFQHRTLSFGHFSGELKV